MKSQNQRTDKFRPKINQSINQRMPWPPEYFDLTITTGSALHRPIEEPGRVVKSRHKEEAD